MDRRETLDRDAPPAGPRLAGARPQAHDLRAPQLRSLLLAATVLLLFGAGVASAAETVVNFDGLAAGTEVKSQYEAEGLKLGFAAEVGQPPPATGDCGAPTVQTGGVSAQSPPNYATLPTCCRP